MDVARRLVGLIALAAVLLRSMPSAPASPLEGKFCSRDGCACRQPTPPRGCHDDGGESMVRSCGACGSESAPLTAHDPIVLDPPLVLADALHRFPLAQAADPPPGWIVAPPPTPPPQPSRT